MSDEKKRRVDRRPRKTDRRWYSPEERASAVRIVRESPGRTIRDIAADLGLKEDTLYAWVVRARKAQIDPDGSMSDAARRRIWELERENARLQRDLDFERKAKAFIRQISHRRNDSR
ncbi:transposase [Microbacterium sp. KHB019]|uniref:transposase n=1 Tax=Microbacterium sp. KHB019 TaxID=3129770 RepID=UPI00307985A8